MISAGLEVQKAVRDTLANDVELVSLLGGTRIYDEVPAAVPFPYVTFGRSTAYDWSTDTDSGREHFLTVHVWSRGGGKKQTLEIMATVEAALATADLVMGSHRLVNIGLEHAEARHEEEHDGYHGLLRYRAVTEPLS